MSPIARALTVAGSDSGGCAGIQADLRTFSALRVHGMTAVTAITAQNTKKVIAIEPVSLRAVQAQIQAVVEDIGCDAVKTGMIPSPEMVELIAGCIERFQLRPLVVDPVLVSTSGDHLSSLSTAEAMKRRLFPLASVVTPNVREAEALTGMQIRTPGDLERAARQIQSLGVDVVVITGGDGPETGNAVDYLLEGNQLMPLSAQRVRTANTHGSGCTFAAAVTAFLARKIETRRAVIQAKEFVWKAIQASYPLGQGAGPLGHFFEFWR